jgi:pilus assembly protein Flp/PilA
MTTRIAKQQAHRQRAGEPAKQGGRMHLSLQLLRNLHYDESGQDLIEYALIAALIAVAAIAAMKGLTTKITTEFNTIGNSL